MGETAKKPLSNIEMLEEVKNMIFERLRENKFQVKVGDLVKVVELQRKLATDEGAKKQFWEFIEQIRQEELKHE